MAPIPEDIVDTHLKATIQTLYNIQSTTHGYQSPPTTTPVLISQITSLATSLAALSQSASTSALSSNTDTSDQQQQAMMVPPEIIAYIEEGRNPDIYTREFVELVQKGNVELKGKREGFEGFAGVLGEEMRMAGINVGGEEADERKQDEGNGDGDVAVVVKKEEVNGEEVGGAGA